jgi:chromosomal replication initiator protein
MTNEELWQAALGELELSLSRANFTTWFKNTFIVDWNNAQAVVGVPNAFTKVWLEKKYHDDIIKTLQSLTTGQIKEVLYKVENAKQASSNEYFAKKEVDEPNATTVEEEVAPLSAARGVNEKYTFKTFVVGKGSELAFATLQAAAKELGKVYNPIFLYGGVGLGKTHLLQAFGNAAKEANPKTKALYVTSEKFTNDFIQAVKNGNAKEFKDNYRNTDVLLIDDIQFLAGKEGTQEEFFHTFNSLHQANKQIVIASDRQPKAISGIEHRLLSRFVWGMIVDVSQPDIETRVAILETKCREKGYELDKEVIQMVATSIQQNVRELEGALNKIIAHHQFNNVEPTVDSVKPIISTLTSKPLNAPLSAKRFLQVVSEFFSISHEDLIGKSRQKALVVPRQIAMYLMRSEGNMSFPGIGDELGKRDHTTAMHACTKIEKELECDETLRQNVEAIKQSLLQST